MLTVLSVVADKRAPPEAAVETLANWAQARLSLRKGAVFAQSDGETKVTNLNRDIT